MGHDFRMKKPENFIPGLSILLLSGILPITILMLFTVANRTGVIAADLAGTTPA